MKRFLSLLLVLVSLTCLFDMQALAFETDSITLIASSVSGGAGVGFYDADGMDTLEVQSGSVILSDGEWVCYSLENITYGVYNIYLTASNTENVSLEIITENGLKGTKEIKKSQNSASFSKKIICEGVLINELDKTLKIRNSGGHTLTFKDIILERIIHEEYIIEAENVKDGGEGVGFFDGQNPNGGGSLEINSGTTRTTVCARSGDKMMYDVSYLEKGSYFLSLKRSSNASVYINIYVDDKLYSVKSEMPKTGETYSNYLDAYLCIINITETAKTLTVENSGNKATYIDSFTLGKVESSASFFADNKILGKNTFSQIEGEGYHDEKNSAFVDFCSGNSVILHSGDWAAYDVSEFPTGIYEVSAYVSCKNAVVLDILLDDNTLISKNVASTGGYATFNNIFLGKVYLDSFQKLIIKGNKAASYIGFLKLKKVSDSVNTMYEKIFSPDDVIPGGNGIGFYDTDTENGPKIEYNGNSVVLRTSEWLCYDVSNFVSGRYMLKITASNTTAALVNVGTENEIIFNEAELKATESFNVFHEFYLGDFDITENISNLKIENVKKASLIIKKITLEIIPTEIDLKVENEHGEHVNRLYGNDKFYITGNVKNNYYLSNGVKILTAFYSENNSLCSVKNDIVDLKINETKDVNIPIEEYRDASLVKIFVWESAKSLMPLSMELSVYKGIDRHFYVDSKAGSDESDGESEKTPLKTIEAAKEKVKKISSNNTGDVYVHLKGNFEIDNTLDFTNEDSGKNGFSIIYDGGKETTISGGKEISGFTEVSGTPLYKVKVDNPNFRQIYVGGNRAKRARSKWFYYVKEEYDNPDTDYINPEGYILEGEDFPAEFKKPSDMEMVWMPSWRNVRMPIENIEKNEDGDLVATFAQPYFDSIFTSNATVTKQIPYYLENAPEFLDEPGEWYVNKDTSELFYYPEETDDTDNLKVYIPYTEKLISIKGEENKKIKGITFKGIDFKYGAWNRVTEKGLSTVQAEQIYVPEKKTEDMTDYPTERMMAQIEVNYGDNINFIENKFMHLASVALAFDNKTKNCKAIGNVFDDLSASAVTIGSGEAPKKAEKENLCCNITVENNLIRRTSVEYMTPSVTAYYVNDITISNNDIKDCPYTGISLGWGWNPNLKNCENNVICGNRIENVMYKLRDGAHIYTLSNSPNSVIENNYLIKSSEWKGGIYLDNGSGGYTIRNNVIEDCEKWLKLTWHNITGNNAYNNFSDAGIGTLAEYLESNNLENAIGKTDGNWGEEAESIILNAGLTEKYKYLLEEYNQNTNYKNDELNNLLYIEKPGVSVGGGNLIAGGEGIAYHDILKDKYGCIGVVELSDGTGHKYMGNTEQGEWTKHKIAILEDGTYKLSMRASAEKKNVKASVWLDDKLVYFGAVETTGDYSDFKDYELGTVTLTEGEHIIKLEHTVSNFMPYSFTLTDVANDVFVRNDGFIEDILNAVA